MPIQIKRKPVTLLPEGDVLVLFEEIAVSLSGGGFRAAGFSLGCLAYLEKNTYLEKTLLSRVKFVTGASGGSLTGILFSAYNHQNIPFSTVYDRVRKEILVGDKLLKAAVATIADDKQWGDDNTKNRNTINAFAKVYQNMVFDNLKFGVYWQSEHRTVEEVCFNASELENGRSFRFQTDGDDTTGEILGNQYLLIQENNSQAVKDLLLGDIMAASSCFPAGFEPMVFPKDFAKDAEHRQQLFDSVLSAKGHDWEDYQKFNSPFALMDGGITDNQGIESLKLANNRRKGKNGRGFDLILICDVANYFLDPLGPIKEDTGWMSRVSMYNIITAHKYASVVLAISIGMLLEHVLTGLAWVLGTVSFIMFGIFLFVRYVLMRKTEPVTPTEKTARKIKHRSTDNMSMFDLPLNMFSDYFLQSPLSRMGLLLKTRIRSAMRVAMDIYVLQIRRINYESLYTNPDWAYKTKAVSIYELSKSNESVLTRQFIRKKFNAETTALLTPSEAMKAVAENARQMETTLWFNEEDMKGQGNMPDSLIACGQFTMCYNLIEYITQIEMEYPEVKEDAEIQKLKRSMLQDWATFQEDPYFMV